MRNDRGEADERSERAVSRRSALSARHICGGFRCNVNALAPDDVAQFLDSLKLSARSYNNFLWALRTFFRYAQKHDWLSKEIDLLARVERRESKRAPVEIFTPAQLAALLEHSSAQLQPCIALAAFAGVRAEEILRLDWLDIERCPGFIEVAAHKAKTASRRIVPICDNLAKWLAVAPRTAGRIWPHSKAWFFKAIRIAAAAAKVTWKHNAPGIPTSVIGWQRFMMSTVLRWKPERRRR